MSGYEYVLERLIQFRNALNLTQSQMAEKLNISQEQYSYLETGKVKITAEILKALAALGLDINYFITGEFSYDTEKNKISAMFESVEDAECKVRLKRLLIYLLCMVAMKNKDRKSKNQMLLEYLEKNWDNFSMVLYVRESLEYAQIPMADELGLGIKKYRKLEKGKIYPDAELLLELYKKSQYPPILFLDICDREAYIMDLFLNELPKEQQMQVKDIFFNVDNLLERL